MTRTSRLTPTRALLALALIAGCGGPGTTHFVHPEADLPFYQKVGVIPFGSLAQDRLAGEKVTDIFYSEALQLGFDEVMEPGQFAAAMARLRGGTPYANPWSSEDLVRLAEETGVQGVFMGTLREYDMTQTGRDSYPLVSLEVRFVDAATGRVVWSASRTRRGGPALPLLGFTATRAISDLTARMCRELLDTLPRAGSEIKPGQGGGKPSARDVEAKRGNAKPRTGDATAKDGNAKPKT